MGYDGVKLGCDDGCTMSCDYASGRGYAQMSMTPVHDGHGCVHFHGHENVRGSSRDVLRGGHYGECP